jgi:hypothetical protein
MKTCGGCKTAHLKAQAVLSVALARYSFATPEIRLLMRHVLGHALSGRTIKRLARSSGTRLRRGRPATAPRVHKGDVSDLIETSSNGLDAVGGNALQLFHHIKIQFGLTPRQYLIWVAKFVRRGNHMMRKCLLCERFFPSKDSGERHCPNCKGKRRSLVINDTGFTLGQFG